MNLIIKYTYWLTITKYIIMLDFIVQKLHREGYRFVAIAAAITFILLLISKILGLIGFVLTIWVYYFFRDPDRFPIGDENYLVSPQMEK